MTPNKGRDDLHWYVGCVRSCQEKNVAQTLSSMSVEHYLPVRREVHRWSDRRKIVECLVIPRFIFIRCRNSERALIMDAEPRIFKFLASAGAVSVVRDAEMETFRRMVEGGGAVRLSEQVPSAGDRVRVTSGPLTGLECDLVSVGGGRCLAVSLGPLGTATMDLDLESVEKI
ncbi:MAG: UpxY family transcription antiterminator [Bacteroidales bacterium]|nr:UpxY family transcription antiterminator [Bacteroidales bacterium]